MGKDSRDMYDEQGRREGFVAFFGDCGVCGGKEVFVFEMEKY